MGQKIAYLGPVGTFSEQAATLYDPLAELLPYSSHLGIVQAVLRGETDAGVVARENSIGGSVADGLDALFASAIGITMEWNGRELTVTHGDLMICGEVQVPVIQCLYVKEGTRLEDVRVVYSHPQGFEQCRGGIAARLPGVNFVPVSSTVAGIPEMLKSEVTAAAIAPPHAGSLYPGAQKAIHGLQDHGSNTTRFVVLGPQEGSPDGSYKTSIWFTIPNDEKPGSFDRVSQILACCGINKRLVESRPTKTELGRYVFLMDIDGHWKDEVVRRALELIAVAGLTTTLRVLGSYLRWENGA